MQGHVVVVLGGNKEGLWEAGSVITRGRGDPSSSGRPAGCNWFACVNNSEGWQGTEAHSLLRGGQELCWSLRQRVLFSRVKRLAVRPSEALSSLPDVKTCRILDLNFRPHTIRGDYSWTGWRRMVFQGRACAKAWSLENMVGLKLYLIQQSWRRRWGGVGSKVNAGEKGRAGDRQSRQAWLPLSPSVPGLWSLLIYYSTSTISLLIKYLNN